MPPLDSSLKVEEHKDEKIKVLNFGSAPLNSTSDAVSSKINLEDPSKYTNF
ncbi:MAG: hypothetical protein R3299_04880 [Arenibacter sp.]|nr:hypothetical protein [Arenibacter sp.]